MVIGLRQAFGYFSNNPAEGYRIPHQLKITQNPCIQKKGRKPYEQRQDYQKRAGISDRDAA